MKLVLLSGLFLVSNWLWDIAHVSYYGGHGFLGNGFWVVEAITVYHFAWYFSIFCFFVLAWEYKKLEKRVGYVDKR